MNQKTSSVVRERYYIASYPGPNGPILFRDNDGSLIINERIGPDEDDTRRVLTVTMRVKPKRGEAWRTPDQEQEVFAAQIVQLLNKEWAVSEPNEVTAHFVTFYSPGTFVAETTTKPIRAWDNDEAIKMMAEIVERYDARPYGFKFTTRGRGAHDLDSEIIATGPMTYVGGKIETREEIEARNDPKEEILRSNLRMNDINRVFVTTQGWKWTQALCPGDLHLPTQDAVSS